MTNIALQEKLNAPLYIDVQCYRCKRRVALSNTCELDGRRYCERCFGTEQQNIEDLADYKAERLVGLF